MFKFDSTVNVSTVFAIAGMLGTAAVGYANAEGRISRSEVRLEQQQRDIANLRTELREDLRELREDQKRIIRAVESPR